MSTSNHKLMSTISAWLDRNSLYIALLVAWVAMLGSLYFSEVAGFIPCVLCWYQRILMYPLTLLLAIGLIRRDANLPFLVLPFSILGLGVSTYHYLLEKTDIFDATATCQVSAPCTTAWINWFGFITIPFLALIGFLTITLMTVIALYAGEPIEDEDQRTPWRPVLSIIVAVLIAFAILAQTNRRPAQATAIFSINKPSVVDQNDGTTQQHAHVTSHFIAMLGSISDEVF